MDKIYLDQKDNVFFLDCTRVNGTNEIIPRLEIDIDTQIENISKYVGREIILADDVVFSGGVLLNIINRLKKYNISVVGIICSVSTYSGYAKFNEMLKYGLKTNYLMSDDVIDQVCERDFYFGIAGSGIMIDKIYKAPYFLPFGNPNERASIPKCYEREFSLGCLRRSLRLWEEIEYLSSKKIYMKDLPERIINTSTEDRVVKILKKEMNNL